MTEKLYYTDAYMKEFEARVICCEKDGEYYAVELDRTAFFPEEGGQYSDRGFLGEGRVFDVKEKEGRIYHYLDAPLSAGERVVGKIDFDERYEKMQCHTAEHILSGLIHKLYSLNNVGFHLGAEEVTMDVSEPLSREQLSEIERLANEAVYANAEVVAIYPTAKEAEAMEYRSKIDITENLRIVRIGDFDSCACCAPHLRTTGEIGLIMILDAVKLRGGMRISIAAGRRAYRIYKKMYENLAEISHSLSVPRIETAEAVKRTLAALEEKKAEYKIARSLFFEREADDIEESKTNIILNYSDATYEELRIVANKATEKIDGVLVLLSGKDGDYKYLLSSKTVDLKQEMKKINTALCGKGGGSPTMAQGNFCATLDEIKEYFI